MKYRSESFAGEGYRDAVAVMAHETFALGNSDILDTLSSGLLQNHPIAKELIEISTQLTENGIIADFTKNDGLNFTQRVLNTIAEVTGRRIKYALWLATRENAYRYALAGRDITMMNELSIEADIPADFDEIDAYDETDGIVLSDIGDDGVLYGFETCPMPMEAVSLYKQ